MNEYVKRLVVSLEPQISDLDEKLSLLSDKKEIYNSISKFLSYVNDDVNLVGIYANQSLILEHLSFVNSNEQEYIASCYLLKSEDENVKALPQYEKAYSFINNLINYFKESKNTLEGEIKDLEEICKEKQLDKKYYEIFSTNEPFVSDIDEFTSFLEKRVSDNNDKIQMLLYTINNNMLTYEGKKN